MTDSSARQEPEYVRCGPCGHIEPEHRPDAGPCLICGCSSYAPESATPGLTPYRRLLARLEADRAGHLRAAEQTTDGTLRNAGSSYAAALHQAAVAAVALFEGAEAAREYAQRTSGGEAGEVDSLNSAELTAEEARDLAADLGLELYRAQDALAFVEECCVIADREGRTVTTAAVREWLKGARCGRQLTADANLEKSAATDLGAEFVRQADEPDVAGLSAFESDLAGQSAPKADSKPATTDLREQVARAIHRYDNHHALSGNDIPSRHHYGEADAVLAVLPPPADRAHWDTLARSTGELRQRTAELRDRAEEVAVKVEQLGDVRAAVLCEAAATYEEILENAPDHAKDPRYWTAIRDVTVGLRRMADETQQEATS